MPDLAQVIVVDVRALGRKEGREQRKLVVDRALNSGEQDNEYFYRNLRARFDRCGQAPCGPAHPCLGVALRARAELRKRAVPKNERGLRCLQKCGDACSVHAASAGSRSDTCCMSCNRQGGHRDVQSGGALRGPARGRGRARGRPRNADRAQLRAQFCGGAQARPCMPLKGATCSMEALEEVWAAWREHGQPLRRSWSVASRARQPERSKGQHK